MLADGYGCFVGPEGETRGWPLGHAKPNEFGIFGLLASTREWVSEIDPKENMSHRRGLCGNSWRDSKRRLESELISYGVTNLKYSFHGFRVVRSRPLQSPAEVQPSRPLQPRQSERSTAETVEVASED